MVLLGSSLRPPASAGAAALVRLAADAGFEGIAVDAGCLMSDLATVAAEGRGAGVPVAAAWAPLAEAPLRPGRRLPQLAAVGDRDERAAAVALARRTIEAARDLGVASFVLRFGPVALGVRLADVRRWFARRELDEGEAGGRWLEAARAERRALSAQVLDACRRSLEPLCELADRLEATLAVLPGATPWEAPSPREALTLVGELAGARVGVVYAPGRLAVLQGLGLAPSPERRAALRAAARVALATDAVGLDHRLLPGLGEAALGDLGEAGLRGPIVVEGPADAPLAEIAAARERLAADLRAAAQAAAAAASAAAATPPAAPSAPG